MARSSFIFVLIAFVISPVVISQEYPVHHPPVEPLPQYQVDRYPLEETTPETKPSNSIIVESPQKSVPSALRYEQQPPRDIRTAPVEVPNAINIIDAAKPVSSPEPLQTTASSKQINSSVPTIDWSLYRDHSSFPVDPRKPCNVCTHPQTNQNTCRCGCKNRLAKLPGYQGKPYQEKEPGGCKCDSRKPNSHPMASIYWPRPMSAVRDDQEHCGCGVKDCLRCKATNLLDIFDPLASVKVSKYQRRDNGYCGPGADPYGCLGESRVRGIGFRPPGEPNTPGLNAIR